jgi:hypothetical protein
MYGNVVAEALLGEVRWREPTLLGSTLSAEEDGDFTEHLEAERWKSASHKWSVYWEPTTRPRHGVDYTDDEVMVVLIGLAACSSEMWSSLSVFVDKIEPSWAELSEYARSSWDLPTLTTRSDDDGAVTVEAQLERLERCSGAEIANAIRIELEQQIENAEEEGATIPVAALIRLVDFVCAHPRIKPPFVFITSETIKAQWQPSPEKIAWIEFDATEHVRLLAFCPDPKAAGGIKRLVANSTVQSAYRDLLGFGVNWMTR